MTEDERVAGAEVFRALGHPVRLGVLEVLADGEKTVTELFQALGCGQSMMSQQLRILEHQGLIRTRKEGTAKYCSLRNPEVLDMFECLRTHVRRYVRPVPAGTSS